MKIAPIIKKIDQHKEMPEWLDQLSTDIEEISQERHPSGQIPEYWDGRTAERVINALLENRGLETGSLRI